MGFVTLADAADALDATEAGVEQLARAGAIGVAAQLEHAVARREPFGPAALGPCVSVRGAPKTRTAERVAVELGIDERAVQGLCASGRLRQVTDYAPADPRLRVALPLPDITPEDIAHAMQLLDDRDEAERNAPPTDPFLTEVANAINAGQVTPVLLEEFAGRLVPRGGQSADAASAPPLPARRGRRSMVEG